MDNSIQIIRFDEVDTYEPALHAKTVNRRLLLTERIEIIYGVISKGGGAEEHSHETLDQMIFMLEGKGSVERNGRKEEIGPGTLVYIPSGVPHGGGEFVASEEPAKFLVIYTPPLHGAA